MQSEVIQLVAHPQRDVDDAPERGARTRIEIDDRVIRVAHGLHTRVPGIDRDGAELHDVEERCQVTADEAALRLEAVVGDRLDAHARRRIVGCSLLIERHSADAIRKPLHDQRAIGYRGQQVRRHAGVIRHQIALRVASLREKTLVEIGNLELLVGAQLQYTHAIIALELRDAANQLANACAGELRRARAPARSLRGRASAR